MRREAIMACLPRTIASAVALLLTTRPALAAVSKGDTAFMISSTVLVLMMAIPGLALFYGGLVRTKNMIAMLAEVFAVVCLVIVIWLIYGYSLTFTNGGVLNPFIGGLGKVFLAGVGTSSTAPTFSNGVQIPEYAYIGFEMAFAAITPALIVGACAERIKFSALLLFIALWSTFVYFPIAHMVWYWSGPDALARDLTDAGYLHQAGAIDFAGGTVVHTNAGIAGLVGALIIGRRAGYGEESMPPHALSMSLIGAALLWVGWFGFNAGSNLEANGAAALAVINTFAATAAAALAWTLIEALSWGKPSLLGLLSGAVAGLVAVTPASGYAGPTGAIALGTVAGMICFVFCTKVKDALGYDDSLDVFGIHCIGGIVGALGTGVLVNPNLGGTGTLDYVSEPGRAVLASYDLTFQMVAQLKAVVVTLLWSGLGSLILYRLVDRVVGLRPSEARERLGLDITEHGERAYNY